jgi:hypothetical protein
LSVLRALLVKISILIILLTCAFFGTYVAYIGAKTRAIERDFNAMQDGKLSVSAWPELSLRADRLAAMADWDFDSQDLRGRVYFYGAVAVGVDAPQQLIRRLRHARDSFQRASQLKPSWAYTHLNLARTEFALDVNGPWPQHLQSMLDSGARDLFLQMDLMRFRKDLNERLSGELQEKISAAQQLGIASHPYEMVRLAAELDRLAWACNLKSAEVQRMCALYQKL